MSDYILGIEFRECEDGEFCLHKLAYKNQCKATLERCGYAIKNNPLCFCNKQEECQGRYQIVNKKEKTYILYNCQLSCPHFLKNKDDVNKILKLISSHLIYYGKSLDNLIKEIGIKEIKDNDLDALINYFSEIFEKSNTRVG